MDLTFQEYLTALAVVEGYYPGRREDDTLAGLLAPRFDDEDWREVIPLAATLAGREAGPLVEALVAHVAEMERGPGPLRKAA